MSKAEETKTAANSSASNDSAIVNNTVVKISGREKLRQLMKSREVFGKAEYFPKTGQFTMNGYEYKYFTNDEGHLVKTRTLSAAGAVVENKVSKSEELFDGIYGIKWAEKDATLIDIMLDDENIDKLPVFLWEFVYPLGSVDEFGESECSKECVTNWGFEYNQLNQLWNKHNPNLRVITIPATSARAGGVGKEKKEWSGSSKTKNANALAEAREAMALADKSGKQVTTF